MSTKFLAVRLFEGNTTSGHLSKPEKAPQIITDTRPDLNVGAK